MADWERLDCYWFGKIWIPSPVLRGSRSPCAVRQSTYALRHSSCRHVNASLRILFEKEWAVVRLCFSNPGDDHWIICCYCQH